MDYWLFIGGAISLFLIVIGAFAWLVDWTQPIAEKPAGIHWTDILVPPLRIKLQPNPQHPWIDPGYIESLQRLLAEEGFTLIGDYGCDAMENVLPGFRHQAFGNVEKEAVAEIFQNHRSGIYFEISSLYQDGRIYGVIVSARPELLDQPPGRTIVYLPEEDWNVALEKFYDNRPPGERTPFSSAEQFQMAFEELYASEMDWRAERNGMTIDEIERMVRRDGQEPTPEQVDAIHTAWRYRYSEFLDAALRERFTVEHPVSPAEWNRIRYRLVFIHDKRPMQQIYTEFEDVYYFVFDTNDNDVWRQHSQTLRGSVEAKPPRQAFAQLNQRLETLQFEPYGQMSLPIAADVYLRPRSGGKESPYLPA